MTYRIPIYDIEIDDENLGLIGISFVDTPAIKKDFVYFNAEKQMIYFTDDEKREIVSPILIPNQLIIRHAEDGSYYYVRWSEDTIRQAALKYIADGFWNNFTTMHPTFYNSDLSYADVLENDVNLLRMWIVDDPFTDDINVKYGFDLPKGTLCVHLKVENEEIWRKVINHELRGLSIEGRVGYRLINMNNQNIEKKNMEIDKNTVNLFQKFLAFMNTVTDNAEAIVEQTKKDEAQSGEVTLRYWLDNVHYMQVDAEGFVRDEEMNLIATGKYMLADGSYIEVDENNKFVKTATQDAANEEKETIEAPIAERAEEVEIAQEEIKVENDVQVEEKVAEPQDEAGDVDADADVQADRKDEPEVVETVEQANAEKKKLTIGEVEYDVDDAVAQRFAELEKQLEDAKSEMVKMSEVTPSVEPIQAPINQNSENGRLTDAIRLLNLKR